MTAKAENETQTWMAAATPMGELMRQYWMPALKTGELVAAGDPVRPTRAHAKGGTLPLSAFDLAAAE